MKDSKKKDKIHLSQSQVTARLGSKTRFKGELSGSEDLTVEGQIEGKINLNQNTLTVERSGVVKAEIHAGNINIVGIIEGDVFASGKVTIEKEGRMIGDITTSRIVIQDGAQFKGCVKTAG